MLEPLLKILTNPKHPYVYHNGSQFMTTDGFRVHAYTPEDLHVVAKAHWDEEDWTYKVRQNDFLSDLIKEAAKDSETYKVKKIVNLLGQIHLPCGRYVNANYLRDALGGRLKPFTYKAHPTELNKGLIIEKDCYLYLLMPLGC